MKQSHKDILHLSWQHFCKDCDLELMQREYSQTLTTTFCMQANTLQIRLQHCDNLSVFLEEFIKYSLNRYKRKSVVSWVIKLQNTTKLYCTCLHIYIHDLSHPTTHSATCNKKWNALSHSTSSLSSCYLKWMGKSNIKQLKWLFHSIKT